MKQFFLLVAFFLFTSFIYSQSLFTYGNHSVSKDEFLRAYNKNKTTTENKDQALRDYLDLYIKFKLKVQAAKDIRLDTLSSLEADLDNFKGQIEDSYLKDDEQVNLLTDEAYTRSRKDIHTLHFFVPVDERMLPADTVKGYKAINETYDELKKGKTDYEDILAEIKEEIAPVQGNDLGFVTVFTLPYEFENIVYGLKPGEVSKPYRTRKGWHIFKNEEERPAIGKIKVAQILFAFPPENNFLRDRAKRLSDSVYTALQAGVDFGELAKKYSDDKMTYMNGGVMPEFGVAKYDGGFENAAFSLKSDGDVTAPFQTEFGYHILNRISRTPIPDNKNDAAFIYNLKQDVLSDDRIETAKEKFVQEMLIKTGYKKNNAVNDAALWKITDSFALANKDIKVGIINKKTVLFSFNNNKVTIGDWLQYVRQTTQSSHGAGVKTYPTLLKSYVTLAATENYRKRLQSFNPDFKYQVEEFKEGNMLFEIMERNIWSKASSDSNGLQKYYQAHKDNYKWSASADAVLYSCASAGMAKNAMEQIEKGGNWKDVLSEHPTEVQADSGRYELSQIPVIDRTNFTEGLVTAPVINKGDGTAVFAQVIKLYPNDQQRSFEDARGLVINDYQSFLEEKWIESLKKKYPVTVNEKVFKSLL
ncbi:MAG: peptidylprolyl isomerase [Ginsengibacter sp.]